MNPEWRRIARAGLLLLVLLAAAYGYAVAVTPR